MTTNGLSSQGTARIRAGRGPLRRLVFPILILLVAAALWMFGRQDQHEDIEHVRRYVRELCMDVAAGRDIDVKLRDSDAHVRRTLPDVLENIIQPPLDQELTELRVRVQPGDHRELGDGSATHTAMIEINDVPMLGLRLYAEEPARRVRVLGYWQVDGRYNSAAE